MENRTIVFAVLFTLLFINIASAKIKVKQPTKKNHTKNSTCPAKDGSNYLAPANPKASNPPDAKSAVFKELKDGDVDFKNFTFKKGASLNGTLTINYYHSKFKATHRSGGEIEATYKKATGDPSNLRWVQLVNSQMPINNPAEKYPIIDPVPEDEPNSKNPDPNKYRPFYWNEEEIADYTGGKNFDLKFYDFSNRTHPPTSKEIWTGDLYIASWDGNTPGTVTLHDSIQWGWVGACTQQTPPANKATKCSVNTPLSSPVDSVIMNFDGPNGTIENIMTDFPASTTVLPDDTIQVNWDEPLEPNTPTTITFTSGYYPVDLVDGLWHLDEIDIEPLNTPDVNITNYDSFFDVFTEINIPDSADPGSATWSPSSTGYNNGQWYHYPHTFVMTVWFENGSFDDTFSTYINTTLNLEPIDANLPYTAEIAVGYSTDIWTTQAIDQPPLPEYISDPLMEEEYIYRENIYSGTSFESQQIDARTICEYNPQWTSISIWGENIKISQCLTNYSDPYEPILGRADFDPDKIIDNYDLKFFCNQWLRQSDPNNPKYESDINGDGTTNFCDFATLAANWKKFIKAVGPSPSNEETLPPVYEQQLDWIPGEYAIMHDLYISTDLEEITDANISNPMTAYQGRFSETTYTLDTEPETTYYWRVDEVGRGDSDIEEGDIWTFTIEPKPSVDPGNNMPDIKPAPFNIKAVPINPTPAPFNIKSVTINPQSQLTIQKSAFNISAKELAINASPITPKPMPVTIGTKLNNIGTAPFEIKSVTIDPMPMLLIKTPADTGKFYITPKTITINTVRIL